MALMLRLGGYVLRCNKCDRVIRSGITAITDAAVARLSRKATFCPRCLQTRRVRDRLKKPGN